MSDVHPDELKEMNEFGEIYLSREEAEENPVKTLNKKFDARCIVCLDVRYQFWIDDNPPPWGCQIGCLKKEECKLAKYRAQIRAWKKRMKEIGVLK